MCSSWGSSHLPWSFQLSRFHQGNLGRNKGTCSFPQPGFGLGWERSRIPPTPQVCSFFGLKQIPVCAQRQHLLCLVFPGLCHHHAAASSWPSNMCCSSDCTEGFGGKRKVAESPRAKERTNPCDGRRWHGATCRQGQDPGLPLSIWDFSSRGLCHVAAGLVPSLWPLHSCAKCFVPRLPAWGLVFFLFETFCSKAEGAGGTETLPRGMALLGYWCIL